MRRDANKVGAFRVDGFLRDKPTKEQRYSNLSQSTAEAEESSDERDQFKGAKRRKQGQGDSEILAVLDMMKAKMEKPSVDYKHTIAKNVDDIMEKLDRLGLDKMKLKLRIGLQKLVDEYESEILDLS
uniref:Uncharacterized protein n=1 Tax=Ditylenchus dipsaci TaxID=166011 RepID=A0A915DXQ2_9BILA